MTARLADRRLRRDPTPLDAHGMAASPAGRLRSSDRRQDKGTLMAQIHETAQNDEPTFTAEQRPRVDLTGRTEMAPQWYAVVERHGRRWSIYTSETRPHSEQTFASAEDACRIAAEVWSGEHRRWGLVENLG